MNENPKAGARIKAAAGQRILRVGSVFLRNSEDLCVFSDDENPYLRIATVVVTLGCV